MSATLDAEPHSRPPSSLSPGDVAVAGFNVIARDWRLVVGWSLFNLLALFIGAVFLVIVLLVSLGVMGAARFEAFGPPAGVVILSIGGVAVQVMVVSALWRRMLRSGPSEFLYLRLGPDELRLFAVALIGVAVGAGPFVVAAILGGIVASLSGWLMLAAAPLSLWLLTRISVIGPQTFVERRVDPGAAWRLTRGHAPRLFGTLVLVAFLAAMTEVAFGVAITVGAGAIGGFQDLFQAGADAFAAHPVRYLVAMALNLAASPFLLTLVYAPWAAAYQALKD